MKVAQACRLMRQTPVAYYWLGFLLADGSISATGQVHFRLAKKDGIHIHKFAKFIHYTGSFGAIDYPGVAFQSAKATPYFHSLGIVQNKTTHARSELPDVRDDLKLAMLAGFVDGDGCIRCQTHRTDVVLDIKCHGNWLAFLIACQQFIGQRYAISLPMPKLNKQGYSRWIITNNQVLRRWYRDLRRLRLPLLRRKWEKIDCRRKSRYEIAQRDLTRARKLREREFSNKAIVKTMRITSYKLEAMMYRGKLMRRQQWLKQRDQR
jgi:hypothetical protein